MIAGVPLDTGDAAQQLHQVEGGEERRHALLAAQGDDQGEWAASFTKFRNFGNAGVEVWRYPRAS